MRVFGGTSPQWDSAALLTIDVQRDFALPDGGAYVGACESAVSSAVKLAGAWREAGLPMVHVVRYYRPNMSDAELCRRGLAAGGRTVAAPGSDGAELVEGLRAPGAPRLDADLLRSGRLMSLGDREWAVYKPRWGAFYRTPLEEHLRGLCVSTAVFAGLNFPNCPRASIYEASERDFRIVAVADALSGFYPRAERELIGIGAAVETVERVLGAVGSAGRATGAAS